MARKELRMAGVPAVLRLVTDRAQMTTRGENLAHVTVEVNDAAGILVPDAIVNVKFGVAGATLMGVANGNIHNVDTFRRPRRWTQRDEALAVIRPPSVAGNITVTAAADGLQGAAVTIGVLDRPYPAQ